jgi:cobyrinic acid a,c-diamide synthase
MVLGESIEDAEGVGHAMTGLLGHATSFAKRRLHLGYRQATLLGDGPFGTKGSRVRGHEFHYAALLATGNDEPLVELSDGKGEALGTAGGRRGHVTGTFFHAMAMAED